VPDAHGICVPVAQQEEQQIQHDEKAEDEIERVLADVDRLSGNELAASCQLCGKAPLTQRSGTLTAATARIEEYRPRGSMNFPQPFGNQLPIILDLGSAPTRTYGSAPWTMTVCDCAAGR
jgi:hypothetical protein